MRSAWIDLPVGPEKYNEEPHRGHQEGQNHREGGERETIYLSAGNLPKEYFLNYFQVTMLSNLKWSDTDNFYMNLGCHKVTLPMHLYPQKCLGVLVHFFKRF